jgi:geranylgeranyl diphosphate synthase, type II
VKMPDVGRGTAAVPVGIAFLDDQRERVESALQCVSAQASERLAPEMRPAFEYALSTSGKRLRPVLCVAAHAATQPPGVSPEAVYRLSCALEIVHTYSLIHDDLPCMDDDDLRRGRDTVHRVFGNAVGVAIGAALLPVAVRTLVGNAAALGLEVSERGALVVELMRAAGAEGMVGGQLLDLEGERREITPAALEAIHRRKTGALLVASLRIGALAGRAEPDLLESLTRYGEALGLAFQIADDVLDVEGNAADLGKTAGRDQDLSKASYPALYGLERARGLARAAVSEAKTAIAGRDLPHLASLADYVVERRK